MGTASIFESAFSIFQRAYKQYVLECLAQYSVEKMPYAILPKHAPSGHKKVFAIFIWPFVVSCFFSYFSWC